MLYDSFLRQLAEEDDPNEPFSISLFASLRILRFEVALKGTYTQWALCIARQWSCHDKSDFYLYILEDRPRTSMDARFCELLVFDVQEDQWVQCDSWHVWWSFLRDWLVSECFSAGIHNRATIFRGILHIIFVISGSESYQDECVPAPPSSPLKYAERLASSYARKFRLPEKDFTDVSIIRQEEYR